MGARFRKRGGRSRPGPVKKEISPEEIQDFLRQVKGKAAEGYRERSLAIHGWICAKCGMDLVQQDYLTAKVDLSKIKPNAAKATFRLRNLQGKKEKRTRFTQKITLFKHDHEHGEHGHEEDAEHRHEKK